ncbi:MAG: hypothetical protein JSS63_07255 [Bacteroidetes bacterium]|nr:hypothetical protein [Bacteroidota bacterium]
MEYKYTDIKSDIPRSQEEDKNFQAEAESTAEKLSGQRRKTAIIAVHGMGRQTKFETLSLFAENLGKSYSLQNNSNILPQYNIKLKKFSDKYYLAMAETILKNTDNEEIEVNVFESYWAPLTQGKVKFRDVISFFITSTLSSVIRWGQIKKFKRRIFDKLITMKANKGVFIYLIITFFILLGIACAVYSVALIAQDIYPIKNPYKSLALLPLAAIIYLVRWFFVEFFGDVSAYISPYKSFKFNEIRDAIQKASYEVFESVYSDKSYDRIIIAGHSLGSVISYDVLNSLIRNDEIYNTGYDVPKRTKAFVTFGSFLDKIVFNFEIQQKKLALRDGILAALQPMIRDYNLRPQKWINIYANADIFSGQLDYFDDPETSSDKRVQNIKDKECRFPVLAHIQYWKKKLLYKTVLKYI